MDALVATPVHFEGTGDSRVLWQCQSARQTPQPVVVRPLSPRSCLFPEVKGATAHRAQTPRQVECQLPGIFAPHLQEDTRLLRKRLGELDEEFARLQIQFRELKAVKERMRYEHRGRSAMSTTSLDVASSIDIMEHTASTATAGGEGGGGGVRAHRGSQPSIGTLEPINSCSLEDARAATVSPSSSTSEMPTKMRDSVHLTSMETALPTGLLESTLSMAALAGEIGISGGALKSSAFIETYRDVSESIRQTEEQLSELCHTSQKQLAWIASIETQAESASVAKMKSRVRLECALKREATLTNSLRKAYEDAHGLATRRASAKQSAFKGDALHAYLMQHSKAGTDFWAGSEDNQAPFLSLAATCKELSVAEAQLGSDLQQLLSHLDNMEELLALVRTLSDASERLAALWLRARDEDDQAAGGGSNIPWTSALEAASPPGIAQRIDRYCQAIRRKRDEYVSLVARLLERAALAGVGQDIVAAQQPRVRFTSKRHVLRM